MLPVLNGFEVTNGFALRHIRTPILLLTGRDAPKDVVQGLDAAPMTTGRSRLNFEVLLRANPRAHASSAGEAQPRRALPTFCWTPKSERRCAREIPRLDPHRIFHSRVPHAGPGRVISRDRLIERVWPDREISETTWTFSSGISVQGGPAGTAAAGAYREGFRYSLKEGAH